jgi:hypothetical protein
VSARWVWLALLLVGCVGCTTIDGETEDHTRLWGEVPTGLGRYLEVRLAEVDDESLQRDLLSAVRREFVRGGLFERVRYLRNDQPGSPLASELRIALLSRSHEQIFDLFEWDDAYIERYELAIELLDDGDKKVLGGHITGLGVDAVSDPEFVAKPKQEDVRLAALHDAAMKMSRALRQAANARAAKALETLPQIALGRPVAIAILGLDDDESARSRQGPVLVHHMRRCFPRLGKSFLLLPQEEIDLGLERAPVPVFLEIPSYRLEKVAAQLTLAGLFLVGKIEAQAGAVKAVIRAIDRTGTEVAKYEASAEGLGALPVVAAKLARGIAKRLQELEQGS